MGPAEREIEALEDELAESDDPVERRHLEECIRDIGREVAEEDAWREEGRENGWL